MSGTGDDLKALNEKLERMMRRLDCLEAILTESRQYPEIAQLMAARAEQPSTGNR